MPPTSPTIHKQVQLPLSTAIRIAFQSLRVRLTRSLLTGLTIAMAIAFLTNIWTTRAFEPPIQSASLAAQGVPNPPTPTTSNARTLWLISLSLLVCAVGITNAMLMSVMERFRDIGTMKCLGALDAFILKLFFLESLFLGLAGSALGSLTGAALTTGSLLYKYGPLAWTNTPWHSFPPILAATTFLGTLLTNAAAYYPAHKAAKLPPIEAMRADV
ncbi:MAG: ABC transporter permease [Phycisphaerae bacterium]